MVVSPYEFCLIKLVYTINKCLYLLTDIYFFKIKLKEEKCEFFRRKNHL